MVTVRIDLTVCALPFLPQFLRTCLQWALPCLRLVEIFEGLEWSTETLASEVMLEKIGNMQHIQYVHLACLESSKERIFVGI